jgi:murein DD-endopeptidase MepM/ murein hydrolase activator NlpD
VAALAALVAGCSWQVPPPQPPEFEQAAEPARNVAPAVESGGGTLTVQPGQTLYALARQVHVPMRVLIEANQLQPPYKLKIGQVLTVPRIREHIVQPGETLYAVARDYDIEASSLARENHLDPPYALKRGMALILPPAAQTAPPPAMAPVGTTGAPPPEMAPVVTPSAGAGSVTVTPLPPPPSTPQPPPASPPVRAAVPPPPAPQAVHAPTPLQPAAPNAAAAPTKPPPPIESQAVAKPPESQAGAKPAPAAGAAAVAAAAAVANHADPVAPILLWPVRGHILSVFGTAPGAAHNEGINIAAPAGTTVSAAEAGTVAYAGNELRGFGNLLLIKHDDGWVTAYAHNEVLLVKKGQKVRRGEPIARVGKTGGVGDPQLHFELRRGTTAVDPLDHLPRLTGDAG